MVGWIAFKVGLLVGNMVGWMVGWFVGIILGWNDGIMVGKQVDALVIGVGIFVN